MAAEELDRTTEEIRDLDRVEGLIRSFLQILFRCGVPAAAISDVVCHVLSDVADSAEARELDEPPEHHLACTDVVFLWRREASFMDSQGRPRALPRHGSTGSFEHLARLAAAAYAADALLEYLTALGAVALHADGTVELVSESVLVCTGSITPTIAPRTVLAHLSGFLSSVEYNLCAKRDLSSGRFERACYSFIPISLVPVLQRLVETRGQNFIDSVDEWLVRHRHGVKDDISVQVGVGAYVFVHDEAPVD